MDNEHVIEQAKTQCGDCFKDLTDEQIKNIVYSVINAMSIFLCWSDKTCAKFLYGQRKEIYQLNEKEDCCDKGIRIIKPYYQYGFDDTTLEVKILYQEGIKDIYIPIKQDDIFYSDELEEIRIDLSSYGVLDNQCCLCKRSFDLIIEYKAGYQQIPDCLVTDFCKLYKIYADKYKVDCLCDDCFDEYIPAGTYVSNKRTDVISTTFKIDESDINRRIENLFVLGFFQSIGTLSNCKVTQRYMFGGDSVDQEENYVYWKRENNTYKRNNRMQKVW